MNRKTGIILSGIVGVVAGLWVWSAVIPKDSIQIGGSTSVSNVMTNLESAYKDYQKENNKNDKDKKIDSFLYSSVGSAGGINSAKSGTYKMGFISKNLDNSVNYVDSKPDKKFLDIKDTSERQKAIEEYFSESKKTAKDGDMHYVQIATDAIIIVYEAPDWFYSNGLDAKFDIDFDDKGVSDKAKKLIQNIYSGEYKWSQVAKDLDSDFDMSKVGNNDPFVQPFAGSSGSGTRTVFDKTFDLLPPKGTDKNDVRVKDQMAPSVGPSDGFMYSSINKNTVGYLSMNYLGQIKDNKKMHAVSVNHKNPKNFSDDGKIDPDYKLVRPYIGLINAKSSDSDLNKLADFLGWIADAKASPDEVGNKKSAAYQYKSALISPEFKLDDSDLIKDIKKDDQNNKKEDKSSSTNSELKQTIMKGYVKEH